MDPPQGLLGDEKVGVGVFGSPCRIEATWPVADSYGLSVHVHEVARVEVGEVFPLRAQVAELDQCQDMMPRGDGRMFPPMATIGLDSPDFVWAAPAPDNVVIPVRGEASIDGVTAQVVVPPHDASPAPVADVSIGDASWQRVTVHRALRAGDTFPWGLLDAKIVRVVEPSAHFVGWVEVALKTRIGP
jgi:hypothetical protein